MNKLSIKSIKQASNSHVYDLAVDGNHNFFITEENILTHNCDYLSPNAQAALRGVMEEYHTTSRFILTCVTGDTRVYSPYGFKSISNVQPHDLVISNKCVQPVQALVVNEANNLQRITTQHGFSVKVTPEHLFLSNKQTVMAKDLQIDDFLTINLHQLMGVDFEYTSSDEFFDVRDFSKFLTKQGLSEKSSHESKESVSAILQKLKVVHFNDEHISAIGRIVGFCFDNGYVLDDSYFFHADANVLQMIQKDINLFVDDLGVFSAKDRHITMVFENTALSYLLEYFGVSDFFDKKKSINDFFNNRLFFRGFVQGWFATSGSAPTASDNLISDISFKISDKFRKNLNVYIAISKYLKRFFDIKTVVQIDPNQTTEATVLKTVDERSVLQFFKCIGFWYKNLEFADIFGFLHFKANSVSDNSLNFEDWKSTWYGDGYIDDRVTDVSSIKEHTLVYDCSFIGHHWYVTNGFISHNCNYPNRVIPALHSRCQGFHIEKVDQVEFTARVAEILIEEGVEFDIDTLDTFVKTTYPDLRKCINMLQMNSQDKKLSLPSAGDAGQQDWKMQAVELFKQGKIQQARTLLCSAVRPEEMEEVYRWLYTNIEFFGNGEQQDSAILIIKQGLVDHTLVADPEINLAAVMIKLARLQHD